MVETERPIRRRDAEATKFAILDAARESFSKAGYDQVSLREIASLAEVDVALVGRYFGSKEELFAAAISPPVSEQDPPVFPEDRSTFGEWLLRRIVAHEPKDPNRLLLLHHSVSNPRAAQIIRDLITERFIRPVGAWIGGPDGEIRATLILAHVSGLGMMRYVIGLETLTNADPERTIALVAPMLQAYVDGATPPLPGLVPADQPTLRALA